jgi:hypothetical protein
MLIPDLGCLTDCLVAAMSREPSRLRQITATAGIAKAKAPPRVKAATVGSFDLIELSSRQCQTDFVLWLTSNPAGIDAFIGRSYAVLITPF